MSDPLQEKPYKNHGAKSQPSKKQQTVAQSLKSTATIYISRFITYVNALFSNKQVLGGDLQTRIYDDLKGLVCKTEDKIKETYEKIVTEVKILQQNELHVCKHYSKEELVKVDTKFREYYITIRKIFEDLIQRLHSFKNRLQTKLLTHEEFASLITYLEEKINQTRKLIQGMNDNIQKTIDNPKLEKKLIDTVENHYKKVKSLMDILCTAVKETNVHGKWKSLKSESFRKSLMITAKSYAVHTITSTQKFIASGKSESPEQLKFRIYQIKNLVILSEMKIKELFDGILKKANDIYDNELQTYKNYSIEELFKVKSNLQVYSVKICKLSDDTLKRLHAFKIDFQRQVITHRDFQNLISYLEGKVLETKNLTENLLKNIQTTIKEPTLGKKLMAVVESNTQKIKIAVDDLYTAIKSNFTKANRFKSLTDRKTLFSKFPVLGKFKPSANCSPLTLPNSGTKTVSECKGNSLVNLHKKRISFSNLSKHFSSTTNHARANKMSGESNVDESKLTGLSKYFNSQTNTGRANVAKATYATVALIAAYFYLKPKSKK